MKKIILFILFIVFSLNCFSQRVVRDSIRAGNEAYKEQMYNTAESKYKAALSINPSEKTAIYNLANTYYKQNKWDESIKQYEYYISIETTDPKKVSSAYYNIGNAVLKKTDLKDDKTKKESLERSMGAYKNALRLNPNDNEARYNLAVVQKMIFDQNGGGGGGGNDNDQNKNEDKKDQNKDKNQQDKQDDPKQNQQMSSQNIEQILKAMEQEEKSTQERVKQLKQRMQERQNENNKRQNKDW